MKDVGKRLLWEQLKSNYLHYLITNDEIWMTTYNQLIEYFTINNRRPSITAKDTEENRLGKWISLQQTNYTKHDKAMNDVNKRLLWEQLKNTYPQYFKLNNLTVIDI